MMEFGELKESSLTSFSAYLSKEKTFVNTEFLIKIVGSTEKYERFVADQIYHPSGEIALRLHSVL